jgi:UDP-glucose 4-epimerase
MGVYIVTGAAGFIGSCLTLRLINDGHQVVTVDNLTTGFRGNIPEGTFFLEGDCQNPEIYKKLPRKNYDAIFHIAGQSSGELSFENPSNDLRTNTESTLHLLKFALSVGCSRFVYASTMSVYGVKPDRPVRENEETLPTSFYGVGKLASEHYIRLYELYGINSTSLRLFNVYGPGQNMGNLKQGMVSIYLAQILKNHHIVVKGGPDRYRDFVYIDDVVEAFMACLNNSDSYGKVINIGTGIRTTVQQLIDKMISIYPEEVTLEFIDNTPGDLHGIFPEIEDAKKLLNYKYRFSLEEGLSLFINSFKKK